MGVKSSSPKMSWVKSLSWIVGSSLVFSMVAHKTIRYGFAKKRMNLVHEKVEYIIQTGPYKEAVHSEYLMEVLGFSSDYPVDFFLFDPIEAQKKLLSTPIILQASVKKIKPNMVYIDYSLRRPVAWLSDFFNAALDKEGVLFPMHPFFSPKKLSEVCLGKSGLEEAQVSSFGASLQGRYVDLAFSLLKLLSEAGKDLFFVKRIDVSEAFASSLGKREIVVIVENELYLPDQEVPVISSHFLRLSLRHFSTEIANYLKLRDHLLEVEKQELSFLSSKSVKEKVIDLRLSQLAFIQ